MPALVTARTEIDWLQFAGCLMRFMRTKKAAPH
jgi:hypothetical protein